MKTPKKDGITVIVDKFRVEGKPRFKSIAAIPSKEPKPAWKPFPVGTIRGPFTCGKGNDPTGGVQFCVKNQSGSWEYVIKARHQIAEARKEIEERAKEILA